MTGSWHISEIYTTKSHTDRQPIANQPPTTHNPISNQSAINRFLAHQSPTGAQLVDDWSPIDCRLNCDWKFAVLIARRLLWLQLFFGRKAVADRLQRMCDQGSWCWNPNIPM